YWVDVLKKNNLLHPIKRDRLQLYSEKCRDEQGADTRIIEHLRKSRSESYTDGNDYVAVPQIANVSMLVYRKDLLRLIGKGPPKTWEELEEICRTLRDLEKPHKLLIETQTYDTLLTTVLELGWAHGAYWYTTPSDAKTLKICYEDGSV